MTKGLISTAVIKTAALVDDPNARPRFVEDMLAVLHADDVGHWAVYIGKVSDGVEGVNKHGDKVPADMARYLFPFWSGLYRE